MRFILPAIGIVVLIATGYPLQTHLFVKPGRGGGNNA